MILSFKDCILLIRKTPTTFVEGGRLSFKNLFMLKLEKKEFLYKTSQNRKLCVLQIAFFQ